MKQPDIHYFIGANSSRGYYSYFRSHFLPLKDMVLFSAWPAAAAGSIFSAVCEQAEENDERMEFIHGCLDNTLQGVILPDRGTGVLNFPLYATDIYSILGCTQEADARLLSEQIGHARAALHTALAIHDRWEAIYLAHMDFSEADALAEETVQRLFSGQRSGNPGYGTETHRFFGAATCCGSMDYIENITSGLQKRYLLKGRPGTGKSTFLKKIVRAALERGFHADVYHCSFDPLSLDMAVIPALSLCVFDSTSPHEYFPTRDTDEIIDIYARAVEPGTDEINATALAEVAGQYKAQIATATGFLKEAKETLDHFNLALLQRLDAGAVDRLRDETLSRLFAETSKH